MEKYGGKGELQRDEGEPKGRGALVSRSGGNKGQGTLEERGVRRRVRGAECRN